MPIVITDIPCTLEELDASTYKCLSGFVEGFLEFERQEVHPGNIAYELSHRDLGEVGTLWLRRRPGSKSEVDFPTTKFGITDAIKEHLNHIYVAYLNCLGNEGILDSQEHLKSEEKDVTLPSSPQVLNTWKAIWRIVKGEWMKGRGYTDISGWLSLYHSDLYRSPDTLRKIIRAGHKGKLD